MLPLEPDTLRDHQASTVYLVTYAQADLKKVGSRKAFADIVTGAFNQNKLFNCVEYWCCAKERQREGGRHYHLALKLTDVYRWKQVKESITKNHGIVVNFQDFKTRYYDAYRYTTKKDPAHIISDNHPANELLEQHLLLLLVLVLTPKAWSLAPLDQSSRDVSSPTIYMLSLLKTTLKVILNFVLMLKN